MESNLTTAPLWSYGIAALGYLAFAMHLLRPRPGQPRDPVTTALLFAAAATVFWAASGLLIALTRHPVFALAQTLFDSLRYAAWFGFALLLLRTATTLQGTPQGFKLHWPLAIAALLVGAGLAAPLLIAANIGPAQELSRVIQYLALAQAVFGLVLIEQLFRNTAPDSRWHIKPLGIGLIGVCGFDLYFHSTTLLFNRIDIDVFTVRGLANALVLPLIVLTLSRTRTQTLRLAFSQSAAFQTTSLAIAGFYLMIASVAGYYMRFLGGSWGGALQVAVLFAALLLLMLFMFSGTMRARLRILVGKHFFRYRYDYREEWLKFTCTLSAGENAQQGGRQVIRGLADMVESPAGTLWLRDAEGVSFSQIARWNMPDCRAIESAGSSLLSFLDTNNMVIDLEDYRHRHEHYRNLTLPAWLSETPNAWLVVPLALSSGIVGFVVLATSRAPIDIDWEVNDLLATASRQAAAFLAQIQATEALLDARKFEAFNRMSAFVVHDLKNIVTQLSLMVRNAERHADNPEFQRDMLETVSHAVERMKQLTLQLREGTTPGDGSIGVDLEALARRIAKTKEQQLPRVEVRTDAAVIARGHGERIERVIGHLVQNALDATPPDGKVWIQIGREGSMATLEVGDTGRGMSQEFMRDRLFKPFQTTKDAGMGIGAYESRQYIQELGGDIRVESKENAGARFFVKLPLIEVSKASDLKQAENP